MGLLAEFVKKEADHLRSEAAKRTEVLDEWKEAVDQLYALLREWVREADGGIGLLRTEEFAYANFREPVLGHYEIKRLSISVGPFGSRQAEVVPKARYVAAQVAWNGKLRRADGLMEIQDRSSAVFYLFRLKADDGDRWFIRSVAEWNADPEYGIAHPLDRDRFEAAVLSILK